MSWAFVLALIVSARCLINAGGARPAYRAGHEIFGRGILVGLEILVAADLIRTIAVEPTLRNVAVLGVIVVVRTVLSFALDVEVDGVWPWQKRASATDARR